MSPRGLIEPGVVCVAPAGTNSRYLNVCAWAEPQTPIKSAADAVTAHWRSFNRTRVFMLAPHICCRMYFGRRDLQDCDSVVGADATGPLRIPATAIGRGTVYDEIARCACLLTRY